MGQDSVYAADKIKDITSKISLNQSKNFHSYHHKNSHQEMVILVEDIMNSNNKEQTQHRFKHENEQGGQAHHDRLRRLFSKRIQRGPKTPPRRIQTDQISNSLLLDVHLENQSMEACSVFIPEDSNPSILYTNSKKFAITEQSKQLRRGKISQGVSRDEDDSGDSDEDEVERARAQNRKNNKASGNLLLQKIKSVQVLPRQKKRDKQKQNGSKEKVKMLEEQKEGRSMEPSKTQKVGNKQLPSKKRTRRKTMKQNQNPNSPKKSARRLNLMGSGSILPPGQGIGQVVLMGQSQDIESNNTLGLSLDSYKDNQDNNFKSINSSSIHLNKKTRTIGNIGKTRINRHKNSLSKKAHQVAENAKKTVINYWNLFVSERHNYQSHYKTIKKIGQGGCGEVFMVMHLATDQIRAMKVIQKNSEKVVTSVFDEIKILRQLDHPNIVKIYEYFQDDKNVYIILEYLKGGSLFDRLKAISRFGEREAAYIMKQVLQALNYCFQKKIVHRDMKLENILFVQEDSLQIKIIDFGSAVYCDSQVKNLNRIVTAYYVAPEIINKELMIQKCDVWSCGVILFILLSGQAPFRGKDEQEILEKVVKGQVNFEENQWKTVSSRAKVLIKQMVEINVKNRNSLTQCIQSPWIKMLTKIDGSFRIDMHQIAKTIRLLEQFQPGCRLRLLVLHFSITYLPFDNIIDKYSKYYSYMDSRHIANLNERDLMKFAQRIHKEEDLEILLQQQKKTVAKLDINQCGGITFSDFLVSTLDFPKLLTSQKLIKLFNLIDKDGDNYMSVRDLWHFSCKKIELEQCKSIVEEAMEYINNGHKNAMNQQINQSMSVANNQVDGLKINFSNFKYIMLLQGQQQVKPDQTQQILSGQPQPQNTGYMNNNNSYLMMVDGMRMLNGTQVEMQQMIANNQSVQNSGILYNAVVNSNTGQLVSPVSKLLNETKDNLLKKTKNIRQVSFNKKSGISNKKTGNPVLSQFAQQ